MKQTDKSSLFLEGEVKLYTRAWQNLLYTSADTLAILLAASVTALHRSEPFDSDRAKVFLSQYPPRPPVERFDQKNTKPVNFKFNNRLYDKDIDGEPIDSWAGCWLKFCYVLKETLNDDARFRGVLSYRLGKPPFDTHDKRWKSSDQIEGTDIYVHTGIDKKGTKKEMTAMAKYFGYAPPEFKEKPVVEKRKRDTT